MIWRALIVVLLIGAGVAHAERAAPVAQQTVMKQRSWNGRKLRIVTPGLQSGRFLAKKKPAPVITATK